MTVQHRAAWIEIGLLAGGIFALVFSAAVGVWLVFLLTAVYLIIPLTAAVDGMKRIRRGEAWDDGEYVLLAKFSKAQRMFGLGVLSFGIIAWRISVVGWLFPLTITAPLLAAYFIWTAIVIRREGWSGEKLEPSATSD